MFDVTARTFTKDQAQAFVPMLDEVFREARQLVEELFALRQEALAVPIGAAVVDEDSAFRIQQLTSLLQTRLQFVTAMGLEVRRVDGLVDIPGWFDGELGYFCWRYGEATISSWHRADEGCTDRRPIERYVALDVR